MSIHQGRVSCCKRVAFLGAWLVVSGMLLLPGRGIAQTIALNNAGSTATVELTSGAGMNSWTVNGQNQLNQQWFWYRTGTGVASPINSIGLYQYTLTGNNTLDAVYLNDQLLVEIIYTLTGGGMNSGNANMIEQILVQNVSGTSFDLNFYQYSNFNLLGSANDNVEIFGDPEDYNYVRQWNGATAIEEAVTSPSAFYAEAALYNQTLTELGSTPGLTLNGNLLSGPGNVTWALQWTTTLAPGDMFDLTKAKSLSITVVPEPGTTALVVLGLCLMGWTVSRRHSVS